MRPRPQRVLVVDDTAEMRDLWRWWLTHWGFAVEEAGNGADAVRRALMAPPDLILMDLWMPVLDGVAAIQQLKEDARTAHVPVLVISAATAPCPNATVAGAVACLEKPCEPEELLRHIRTVLTTSPAR